jgi:hypothetical protein
MKNPLADLVLGKGKRAKKADNVFKDLVFGKKTRKGAWSTTSKKKVTRLKRTRKALRRKAYIIKQRAKN